jgi:membrane associated rhomboid family serine protease
MKKLMKKIIRNIPFITVTLFIITVIVTVYFNTGSDFNSFGINDILCMFGHADAEHFLGNMSMFLLMGAMTESLLRKRRWMYMVYLGASIISCVINAEVGNRRIIGASGWISSMPAILVFAGLLFWYENRDEWNGIGILGGWAAGFGAMVGVSAFAIDYTLSHDKEYLMTSNIAHYSHINGAATGFFLAVVSSVIYLVSKFFKN